ncbi:MAG: serine/threonine protein kinase [Planctomycetota bacterium]|jgi:serine/threonine protein kinase
MTAERAERGHELFEQAVERPPEERSAFLAEACSDVELRAEVESLLAHDSAITDDFMKPPEPKPSLMDDAAPDRPDPLIGQRVGSFHLKQVIAAGGMGTVYEAVQERPHRTVALKVMKRNIASRSALRRFQLEAQVLGRLRHPNIAQVFQAGMHDEGYGGVPYFAMEYVPGAKSITEYASEKKLGTRDRLRLFAKACDAVHHGHQKGIIHRDLKPANILVDSAGEPRVIDFGVARATDSDLSVTTQQTYVGQLLGTMQYMSPEQCDADPHDLDTRSDIYSLGVVLYELLTGEPPYDASSSTIYEATRAIKEQAPRKLSSINRKLRGNVETITLTALEKDRDRRYQSAAGLARDIRRHLNREPIEARPPTIWTRAIHLAARHPVVTTALGSFGIAAFVAATTFASLWFVQAQPYRLDFWVDFDNDQGAGSEAHLLARSGRELHTWSRGEGIRFARLVDRPKELGGRRLVLLGFNNWQRGSFPGALCAFDAQGDFENPLWERRIETVDVLPELRSFRGATGENFGVERAWLVDVFPNKECPEQSVDEIVVSSLHWMRSQIAIRIYDLRGELQYQVWHDGMVQSCYWMSDAGLLVFAGDCHWPYHDDYGNLLGEKVHDLVVFALRPEPGFIADRYLDYLASEPGDERLDPAWYQRLRPDIDPDNQRRKPRPLALSRPDPPRDPGRSVMVQVRPLEQLMIAVQWVTNELGQEVPGSRIVGDSYKRNQNLPDDAPLKVDLPDPDDFKLLPMTLTEPSREKADGSPGAGSDHP